MKKTFRMLGVALVAVLVAVGFTACGNDDDDDEPYIPSIEDIIPGGKIQAELVGTWVGDFSEDDYIEKETLTFKSNGTFNEEYYYKDSEEVDTSWVSGKWSASNNLLGVVVTRWGGNLDEDDLHIGQLISWKYEVVGDNLYLYDLQDLGSYDVYKRK